MLLLALVLGLVLKYKPRPARPQPKDREGVLHPDDPLYDSFRRHDQYGKLGADPQPMLEYLRLAFLFTTVVPLRLIGAFSCVFSVNVLCRHELSCPFKVASLTRITASNSLMRQPGCHHLIGAMLRAELLAGRCRRQCRRAWLPFLANS